MQKKRKHPLENRRDAVSKILAAPLAGLLLSLAAAANASPIIYDSGKPEQSGGYFADSRTPYTQAAASFGTYNAAGATGSIVVDGINWWGFYSNFYAGGSTAAAPADSFTLNIYNYGMGAPGTLVDSVSLGGGNRTSTGRTVTPPSRPAANEYAYSASFTGVNLSAGYYYFALSDHTTSGGNWALEFNSSDSGPGGASYDDQTSAWIPSNDINFPMQLTGVAIPSTPIPGTLWLMLSGVAGLGAFARRRLEGHADRKL